MHFGMETNVLNSIVKFLIQFATLHCLSNGKVDNSNEPDSHDCFKYAGLISIFKGMIENLAANAMNRPIQMMC